MRQRLPAGVERDLVGRQQAAEGVDEILGLAPGAGDRQDEALGAGRRRQGEGLDAAGTADRQGRRLAGLGGGGERGIGERGAQQAGEGHKLPFASTTTVP